MFSEESILSLTGLEADDNLESIWVASSNRSQRVALLQGLLSYFWPEVCTEIKNLSQKKNLIWWNSFCNRAAIHQRNPNHEEGSSMSGLIILYWFSLNYQRLFTFIQLIDVLHFACIVCLVYTILCGRGWKGESKYEEEHTIPYNESKFNECAAHYGMQCWIVHTPWII